MQEMTPEQVVDARKRCEAALVGSWRAFWQHEDKCFVVIQEDGSFLAEFNSWADWVPDEANADFAAHARTDLPLALDTIESLRQGNDNLGAKLAETHSYMAGYRDDNDVLKARLAKMREALNTIRRFETRNPYYQGLLRGNVDLIRAALSEDAPPSHKAVEGLSNGKDG